MAWSTSRLSQARQYFGAAPATPEIAVFAGGFFNDERLSVVDMYNSSSGSWSQSALSVNRSNLLASNVGSRYAAFGSGNINLESKMAFDIYDGYIL